MVPFIPIAPRFNSMYLPVLFESGFIRKKVPLTVVVDVPIVTVASTPSSGTIVRMPPFICGQIVVSVVLPTSTSFTS